MALFSYRATRAAAIFVMIIAVAVVAAFIVVVNLFLGLPVVSLVPVLANTAVLYRRPVGIRDVAVEAGEITE